MTRPLAELTSPEIAGGTWVLVPVGSIEQHGPHLPLDTDTVIAVAVAQGVADALHRPGVLVAPPLAYGSSGEHQDFAGTSSIGTDTLQQVIVELVRSLRTWAGRVVFVNAHGGNLFALQRGVRQLLDEGHEVGWLACATEEVDAHAGFTETSLMLHLRPESVRLELAVPGNTSPVAELLPALVAGGVSAVSPNGVLGDPAGASAAEGARVLDAMIRDLSGLVVDGVPDERGRLR
ncbi:Putative mycofactocin system creatinine amidohydrolase family protein MftE [metagenome]|uniref:Mycofactocin system creatinine amidohydrolase family protein MftE n=1 Tax=metagenome TaxID=256318 RepID=A0A2P2C667_9ZZZZ